MNLMELIDSMEKRPKMYVMPVKIEYIFYFIFGYLWRKDLDDIERTFRSHFHYWIVDWIVKNIDNKYEMESFLWYHAFISVTKGDQEAVDLFFKASREFFDDYKNNRLP